MKTTSKLSGLKDLDIIERRHRVLEASGADENMVSPLFGEGLDISRADRMVENVRWGSLRMSLHFAPFQTKASNLGTWACMHEILRSRRVQMEAKWIVSPLSSSNAEV